MENINLIKKIARNFSITTGLEFDDLFQEAALAYCKALGTFKSKKMKTSTYMWWRISNHLKDYLKTQEEFKCKRQRVKTHQEALDMKRQYFSIEELDIDKPVSYNHLFESFSKDAQRIASVIIENPQLFDSISPDETIIQVADILEEKGIKMSQIWIGIKDLQLALL
jgi:RNA polymerase sigma factor (sigma-70 family)